MDVRIKLIGAFFMCMGTLFTGFAGLNLAYQWMTYSGEDSTQSLLILLIGQLGIVIAMLCEIAVRLPPRQQSLPPVKAPRAE